jgi:outer membrane protein TolC
MTPEWQILFNSVIGLVMFLGGAVLYALRESLQELKKSDDELSKTIVSMQRYMEENFVRATALRDALKPLQDQLQRIESKLDRKMDRSDCERIHDVRHHHGE